VETERSGDRSVGGETEKMPIDAKLLSDAVIELNISRRSVGLYPREHPITRESIERAYGFIQRLFEFRSLITLGTVKDALVIDDYMLDRKNPVFREFAISLYARGIAAITFYSGLTIEELLGLHELIVEKDVVTGQSLLEQAAGKGLKSVRLTPFDASKLGFAEGCRQQDGEVEVWENYIYGLVAGNLADADAEGVAFNVPPEDVAHFVNNNVSDEDREVSYDRVITSYLRRKDHTGTERKLFSKFLTLIDNLRPEVKQQFLKRALSHPAMELGKVEGLVNDLSAEEVERMTKIFEESSTGIPETMGNLLHTLRKKGGAFCDTLASGQSLVDDIEMDEDVLDLFKEDHFRAFVPEDYHRALKEIMKGPVAGQKNVVLEFAAECSEEAVEKRLCALLLELLGYDLITKDDYVKLLAKISDMANDFLETGRFHQVSEIYAEVSAQATTGLFPDEARGMLETLFHSPEFVARLIEVLRIWGRHNREGIQELVNDQRSLMIPPLLDTLSEEPDPSIRKFLIQLLSTFGKDAISEAARRLDDERWFVVRNMIYLIREVGGREHIRTIRRFAKNNNRKVCIEAIKTLLHFHTPDASSYLKLYLQGTDMELRDQAVKMAGSYKSIAAVPYLIELVEKKDRLGTESYYKVAVVKALGEIGDPRALGALEKLCSAKVLFYKSSLEDLKVEIFRSLHKYPRDSINSLLETGMKSKNEEIHTICRDLHEKRRS
jgi:hypothetical protein